MDVRLTHVGAATLILDIGSLRFLTDPVFDPAGGRYSFGWGTGSRKLTAPAVPPEAVGHIDAVLLSHDQHQDNLDTAGRELLRSADRTLTTPIGARRLGGTAEGLRTWERATLVTADGVTITITATPAQHGTPGIHLLSGATTGFMLEWAGQRHGALYISGDTLWFKGIAEVGQRFKVGTAITHLGKASFPITGPAQFTMNAAGGVKLVQALQPRTVIPVHYEGWAHFREPQAEIGRAFTAAGLADRLLWLTPGVAQQVEV
ncbi:MAG: MBL fold metallo-hydrolase [Anaerolinea sp.]|nr:MBL fold metallo-hydrolase [Anaerolinea sp.]